MVVGTSRVQHTWPSSNVHDTQPGRPYDTIVSGDASTFAIIDRVAMTTHGTVPPGAMGSIGTHDRRRDHTATDRRSGAAAPDLQEDPIDITLLYFPDCPNWRTAGEHLRALADEQHDLTISRLVIDTDAAAQASGFRGSPTIHIDGVDPFADPTAPAGLSCRLYRTPDGVAGSPTLNQLREVVRDRRSSRRSSPPPAAPTT